MKAVKNIFFIIPLLFVLLGNYFQYITGLYSLRSIDPEYIYFISGLSVANGELELGHIDNPGTPLQYLLALLFRIIYFLRSHQTNFIEDALTNADMYLSVSNIVIIALVGFFLYYAGLKVYKNTKNIAYALLIQTTPFYTGIIYGNIGRVTPENILPVPVVLLTILLVQIAVGKLSSSDRKFTIFSSLIMAFGLSIKLTFFPILIIPFIVIRGWKKKALYSILTPVFFFVFALPATLQIKTFWNWVKALFLHSGQYGKGEESVIDFQTIVPNLQKLWNGNAIFFLILLFFIIILAVYSRRQRELKSKLLIKISLSLIAACILQILLVSKQFEQRYFVNALFLIPALIVVGFELTKEWHLKIKQVSISLLVTLVFILAFSKTQVPVIRQLSTHLANQQQKRMPAYHFFQGINANAIKILVPGYYNCPSPEYALRFSYGWAGKQKELYQPYLADLFPNTIIFYFWDKTFNHWNSKPDLENTTQPIYVYLEHFKHLETIDSELKKHIHTNFALKEVFRNEDSNEVILIVEKQKNDA